MNVTVYLGSRPGDSPAYTRNAETLGNWIGSSGHTLIYGGSDGGLMGVLASAALNAHGKVIGVLPQVEAIMQREQAGLSQIIYTEDVAARRSRMIELADAFVVLPGGLGTLDEISEVLSLASLDLIWQPIVFFGAEGYFEPFRALFRHMIEKDFSSESYFKNVLFTEELDELAAYLNAHNTKAKLS